MSDKEITQLISFFALVAFMFGLLGGNCFGSCNGELHVYRTACSSACERLHTKMKSVEDNVCLCEDLSVMRGDVGQTFLKGHRGPGR